MITVESILQANPCNPDQVRSTAEKLFPGRTEVSFKEILRHPEIGDDDKLWIATWANGLTSDIVQEHNLKWCTQPNLVTWLCACKLSPEERIEHFLKELPEC